MPETKSRPRYRVHIEVEDTEHRREIVSMVYQTDSVDLIAGDLEDASERVYNYEDGLDLTGEPAKKPDENVGPVCWCEGCRRERVQVDFRRPRQLCADCTQDEAAGVALPMMS